MARDLFVFVPESIKDIIKSKYLHKTNFLTCVFNHGGGLCAFHILFNHQYGGGTRVGQGAPISLHAPGARQSLPARRVGTGREQAEGGCRRQGWGWGWDWGWGCSSSYVPTSPRPRSSRGLSAEMSYECRGSRKESSASLARDPRHSDFVF